VHAHDLFDRDLVHTVIVRLDGGREVVIGTGKGGVVVALDPGTGALLWQTPVGHHENDDLIELSGPTVVAPGPYGGVITPPATAGGVIYAVSVDAPTRYVPNETSYFAAELGQAPGEMTAIDAHDGAVKWTIDLPGDPFGAATVVNDLVLTPLLDGTLLAVSRADGSVRWRTKLAGGVNGWMAVTGDELIIPLGLASPPRIVAYRLP
jgi:outer membrane protein assembly factor BamB